MPNEDRDLEDSLGRRVASLEATVRALTAEIEQLRAQTGAPSAPLEAKLAAKPANAPHPMTPPQSPLMVPPELRPARWLSSQIDFESLVGRYGTLVLATISALAAVGTFLGWAIANNLLGPSQRIALGLIVSAGLAVGGLRLRRRERSFGASLLGLALAIAHVCAWGAGPSLHLVPTWGAFLLAATASIALAIFAHAESDEPLWCVGFSGAAVAPFVTSGGRGDLLLLSAYGITVLASSGYAMGTRGARGARGAWGARGAREAREARRWVIAGRMFLLAAAFYTVALAMGSETKSGPLLALGFPLAVAVGGVVPWIDGWARRDRLRALGSLAALAAIRSAMAMRLPFSDWTVAALIATAGVVWLVLVDRTHHVAAGAPQGRQPQEGDWLDAGVLPMGFVVAGVMALDGTANTSGIGFTAAGLVLLMTVGRSSEGSLRDAAVFATVLCALLAVLFLEQGKPGLLTATIGVMSALCFVANLQWQSVSWTTLGAIGFAWAILASLAQLSERPAYDYTPFGTEPSAVSAVLLVSIIAAWRLAREPKLEVTLRGAAVGWAFVWIHQELAFALNPTAATLFRVTYYAATSVAAVGVGRARRVALLRHLGLVLGVLAAGTALYGARKLDSVGARIGADLVAAVFLLAIAYWYRRPGGRPSEYSGVST